MKSRGFTLLELLLYAGISATILGVALSFQLTFLKANSSTTFVDDINNAKLEIDQTLLGDIRSAKSISIPAADNTTSDSLEFTNSLDSSYIYTVIAGGLYKQQTSPSIGPLIRVTAPEIRVISAHFTKINNGFSDGIRYTLDLAHTPRANSLDSDLSTTHTNSGALLK